MNYNDKILAQQGLILNTEQDQHFKAQIFRQSVKNNIVINKILQKKQNTGKIQISKGKQNENQNVAFNNYKNLSTNHSFNGFFNQNKKKLNINSNIQKQLSSDGVNLNYQVNSPTNFNSSGKLSNMKFINDSSKVYQRVQPSQQNLIHPQVSNFIKKYFPSNYQTNNYYGLYVTIQDFVDILFEEFQKIIGTHHSSNLIQEFTNSIYLMFNGPNIYFQDLFERTYEKGLTGFIFDTFKSIQEDQKSNKQLKQPSKNILKNNLLLKSSKATKYQNTLNIPFSNSNLLNKGMSVLNSNNQLQQFIMQQSNRQKISLDKFFGSGSLSKINMHDQQTTMNEQNLQQIKLILQEYVECMYQEAEAKLSKNYGQEMKKITLKYKETEKLLQKINQKISNHYDSLQLQREYEKKIKVLNEKVSQSQKTIKSLEYEVKRAKEQGQKQKIQNFKLSQNHEKIKQKLQKYQNAIFEKAMQKNNHPKGSNNLSIQNSSTSIPASFDTSQNSKSYVNSQISTPFPNSKFQLIVDTFTEHRPILSQTNLAHLQANSPPLYTSYFTKQPLSPINKNQNQRVSVSPIKQRVSFVKTQNPTSTSRIIGPLSNFTGNNLNNTPSVNKLKQSNVQKVQIGQPIHIRPLSPIGKLGQTNKYNEYLNKTSYSPIKISFCTSRISTMPVTNPTQK